MKNNGFTLAEGSTHAAMPTWQRKVAFTLAEVLITLGIIGVVAALTLPSLIQDTKKQETSARLKKFNSFMLQALITSENENGPAKDWDTDKTLTSKEFLAAYIAPYVKYTKLTDNAIYFADGSSASVGRGSCLDIVYDTNGDRLPNKEGKDKYRFLSCSNSPEWCDGRTFCTYYSTGTRSNRTTLLNNCKLNGSFCSALLEYDNWEFKDDYPMRL